jgi:hypothetical protein
MPNLYIEGIQVICGALGILPAKDNEGIYITAKGKVATTGFGEYDQLDCNSFGDVLEDPLEKIIFESTSKLNSDSLSQQHRDNIILSNSTIKEYKKIWDIDKR